MRLFWVGFYISASVVGMGEGEGNEQYCIHDLEDFGGLGNLSLLGVVELLVVVLEGYECFQGYPR